MTEDHLLHVNVLNVAPEVTIGHQLQTNHDLCQGEGEREEGRKKSRGGERRGKEGKGGGKGNEGERGRTGKEERGMRGREGMWGKGE